MLPPVSVPRAPRNRPAATPLAEPELDPPGQRRGSAGWRGTGKGFDGSGIPHANSIVVDLPQITAPAARSRATAGASPRSPHDGSSTMLCAVVGPSLVL